MFIALCITVVIVLAVILLFSIEPYRRISGKKKFQPVSSPVNNGLTPWSKSILSRYNKLPAELRTIDIVPLLRGVDAGMVELDAMYEHWNFYHRGYSINKCITSGPQQKGKCVLREQHHEILQSIRSLEAEAKRRARAERMLEAAYDIEQAPVIIKQIEDEVRIHSSVTEEMNKLL